MEDTDFMAELRQMVMRRAESMHLVDTLAFVAEVAERLEEDPAFGECILAEDSREGMRGRQIRLHAFSELDESDGTISMVIGRWSDDETPTSLRTADIDQMRGWLEAFAQEAIDGKLDERIVEASPAYQLASLLRRRKDAISCIRFHILSNQSLSRQYKRESRSEVSGLTTETHIWDFQRLKAVYSSSREREVVEIALQDFHSPGIPCIEASSAQGLKSFLCVINGELLADLFDRFGSRLLEGNVRSFLGMKGGVNKGIRGTIQDAPALFFAYNNGIAATAAEAKVRLIDGALRVTAFSDLQIVNGGQTTASILRARKHDRLSLAGVSVPMKLTVVARDLANDLIPKIAEFANTQNKVAVADFFANHPFHRRMEEISRRLMTPARAGQRVQSKWFYERSRGQFQNERLYLSKTRKDAFDLEYPAKQVINKTELAKYDSVLEAKPQWVSLGAQKNFVKFAGKFSGKGEKTEAQQWEEMSPLFGESYYQRIVAMAILWKSGEDIVSSGRGSWYEGDYRLQIVAYAWAFLFSTLRISSREPDLQKIWDLQEIPSSMRQAFTRAAVLAQRSLLNVPEGSRNVGEWAKKDACWQRLAETPFRLDSSALDWSIGRDEVKAERKDARRRGVQDDGIALQKLVVEKSANGFWRSLIEWSQLRQHVFGPDVDLLRRASTPPGALKISSEREWKRLKELAELCELEGFRHSTGNQ